VPVVRQQESAIVTRANELPQSRMIFCQGCLVKAGHREGSASLSGGRKLGRESERPRSQAVLQHVLDTAHAYVDFRMAEYYNELAAEVAQVVEQRTENSRRAIPKSCFTSELDITCPGRKSRFVRKMPTNIDQSFSV